MKLKILLLPINSTYKLQLDYNPHICFSYKIFLSKSDVITEALTTVDIGRKRIVILSTQTNKMNCSIVRN